MRYLYYKPKPSWQYRIPYIQCHNFHYRLNDFGCFHKLYRLFSEFLITLSPIYVKLDTLYMCLLNISMF